MQASLLPVDSGQEFENLRRVQETRNEMVINVVQLVHFSVVVVANVATLFLPVAPYRASAPLLALLIGSLVFRLVLFAYLRRLGKYHPARKFIISTIDLAVFTAAPLILSWQGAYPGLFLSVFTVCIFVMLIVLSGLRYDTRVVIYNGVATVLLHASCVPWLVPSGFQLPVLTVGLLTLSCVAFCTAYNSASLVRVYREATIKEQLARFLSPELVEQVVRQPSLLQRRTERRNATVIFADIRGFTRISEQLTPERVVELLNEVLEQMTLAIMQHQGMVDKYIGDAVMGVFGVPLHVEDHALRAARAALDMRDRLIQLNAQLRQQGLPEVSIGIGLHTGELLFGAIGSTRRLDYTVVGDTVNVASRIEGMTRSYPVEILLSDATRAAVGDAMPLYSIATVQVKNRTEPLRLWSPDPPR
jgi:class 3 adenylate cyclase